MTTAVGSGETRASTPARAPMTLWVRVLAATVLVAMCVIAPPFGTRPATAAPPALSVTLTQGSAESTVGSNLTLTATVTWSGGDSPEPPGGWYVEFTGTADEGWSSGPVQTDDGVATYVRTTAVAQTETISAVVVAPACETESDPVTHVWREPDINLVPAAMPIPEPQPRVEAAAVPANLDITIDLTQPADESRVGIDVPFTAHLSADGNPLTDWDVTFAVDGEELGTLPTDAQGVAVMPASRSTESFSWITATVRVAGCGDVSDGVDHYWWSTQLELTPEATTSPARQDVVFTAEVARTVFEGEAGIAGAGDVTAAAIPEGMAPLEGQLIRFTMSSQNCNLPVEVREDPTDEIGIAEVTLSRDGPSIDDVRAEEVEVFDPASDTTTHAWGTPAPVPVSITLAQSTPESRAGTDVTYTATVHDTAGPGGHADAGVPVTFLGVSPSRTALTDDEGVARTTIAGTGTAATTITASTAFGCGLVLSAAVTHRWFVPTLELRPVSATSKTGETATVTAWLHHGNNDIEGQQIRLTIDSSTAGEPTKIMTRPTKSNGRAGFSWVRTNAGTDDLTALELIEVLPQQDSATHIWEAPPVTPKPDTPTPVTPEPVTPPPVVITEPPDTDEPTTDEPSEPETPTSPPSSPPATEPLSDLPATSKLVDGPEVGRPGADIEVSGNGCKAGEPLAVLLGETELGKTRAAADGTFYLRGVVPDLPLGRYVLRSTCGKTIGDPNVDVTSPQVDKARAAIAAVGVTTASTFAFFLLIAKGVISFLPRRPL